MKTFIIGFVTVALALMGVQASAQDMPPTVQDSHAATVVAPGHYATEQGWGWLVVKPPKNGSAGFSIESQSTFTEGCEVDGEVAGRAGVAQGTGDSCSINFKPTLKGVSLKMETVEACRQFCGMNGSFEGEYLRDANPSCMPKAVNATRDHFKKLYDGKDYRGALGLLQPVLSACTPFLGAMSLGQIRNDLAVSQYRNGQRVQCLATLEPYRKDAGRTDKAILKDWGRPDVAAEYLAIIKAARTNLRLCRG